MNRTAAVEFGASKSTQGDIRGGFCYLTKHPIKYRKENRFSATCLRTLWGQESRRHASSSWKRRSPAPTEVTPSERNGGRRHCEASGGREVSKPEPLKAAQTPKDAGPGQTQASELLSLLFAGGGVWTDEHGCETHPLNSRPAGSPRSMQEPHLRRGCGLWHGDSAFHEPELRSLGFGSAQAPVANALLRR